jgi:hypothetical protein
MLCLPREGQGGRERKQIECYSRGLCLGATKGESSFTQATGEKEGKKWKRAE